MAECADDEKCFSDDEFASPEIGPLIITDVSGVTHAATVTYSAEDEDEEDPCDLSRQLSSGFYVTQQYRRFDQDFEVGDLIGQPGQFGMAFVATSKRSTHDGGIGTGVRVCVKEIHKAKFHHIPQKARIDILAVLQNEIATLKMVSHENIVKLYDVYEDRHKLHLVMEYLPGGELFERICEESSFSEETAAKYMQQILSALDHMHDRHILHLDLKPENIIFDSRAPDAKLKLIDFGMARVVPRLAKLHQRVGTPAYMAPEVFFGAYGKAADVWSVGVIMFCMIFGYPPFFVDDEDDDDEDEEEEAGLREDDTNIGEEKVDEKIGEEDDGGADVRDASSGCEARVISHVRLTSDSVASVSAGLGASDSTRIRIMTVDPLEAKIKEGFHAEVREGFGNWFPADIPVSASCKKMISGLLHKDIIQRWTAKEALLSAWINHYDSGLTTPVLFTRLVDKLKVFTNHCKFRSTIAAIFSQCMDAEFIDRLKQLFEEIDLDGDGHITFDEFKLSMKKHGSLLADTELVNAFDSLDIDGSGTIEIEEVINAAAYRALVARDERMFMIFSKIDKDGSGKISKEEMIKAISEMAGERYSSESIKSMTEEWVAAFDDGDTDGDGEIDYEEFLRILHPEFNEHDTIKSFTKGSGIAYSGAEFRLARDNPDFEYSIDLPPGTPDITTPRHPIVDLDDVHCVGVRFKYKGRTLTVAKADIEAFLGKQKHSSLSPFRLE